MTSALEKPKHIHPVSTGISSAANDRWSQVYAQHGEVWGKGPSPAGKILIKQIEEMRDRLIAAGETKPKIWAFEAGFGYGRDAIPILGIKRATMRYAGIDPSPVGLELTLDNVQKASKPRNDSKAWLIPGDFTEDHPFENGRNDFFFSHRVMHLLKDNKEVLAFLGNANKLLKPGGMAVVSVRDERDFKKDLMDVRRDGKVVYKDRPDHVITLWNEADLKHVFEKSGFVVQEATLGSEPESKLHPKETTHFTVIKAIKPVLAIQ